VRPIGVRLDHGLRRDPLGVAARLRQPACVRQASTTKALRFSIRAGPMKQSLASLPGPLRYSFASGSVVEACVSFERF
jgi:hypothetical protein